jgi:hypothetical protein
MAALWGFAVRHAIIASIQNRTGNAAKRSGQLRRALGALG